MARFEGKNSIKQWHENGFDYYLFKLYCMPGYTIEKYDINGEYVDSIIGANWYSLVYYFEHKEQRYDSHKDF